MANGVIKRPGKILMLLIPANGSVSYTPQLPPSTHEGVFIAAARMWSANARQVSIISWYASSSRRNVDTIAGTEDSIFSVTGSESSETFTFTNNTDGGLAIFITPLTY